MVARRKKQCEAFTLVELLVVISIIALLVAILLPSLKKAREQAKTVICTTRLHGLGLAALTYHGEYQRMPPTHASLRDLDSSEQGAGKDWLGVGGSVGVTYQPAPNDNPLGGTPPGFDKSPTLGLLWKYAGQEEIYRCPSERLIPVGSYDSQNSTLEARVYRPGSENWKFSYTMFANMGLRSLDQRIPTRMSDPASGGARQAQIRYKLGEVSPAECPLFAEEHPKGVGRFDENGHVEGTFNYGTDSVVGRHGPFQKRQGIHPDTGQLAKFTQGQACIVFSDGHAEPINVAYGMTEKQVRDQAANGLPDAMEEILKHYRIQNQEIHAQPGGGLEVVTVN